MGEDRRWATPSDLAAALAAMGEGEAEQVIRDAGAAGSFDMQTAIISDLRNKLAAAEGCAEACRAETRRADAAWAAEERLHKEAAARAEKAEQQLADAGLERHGLRLKLEKAERERDEAVRSSTEHCSEEYHAWAKVAELKHENEELRTRLAAAEKNLDVARVAMLNAACATNAAAESATAPKPREYPLAEGSRWEVETIRAESGALSRLGRCTMHGDIAIICEREGERRCPHLADVLALAHRRGLL